MKKEFIEYAIHTWLYKKDPQKTLFFSSFFSGLGATIILITISLPMLLTFPYLTVPLLALWGGGTFVCLKKEKNQYMKAILLDGMLFLCLAMFFSAILMNFSLEGKRAFLKSWLPLTSITFLLIYETVALIKIKLKKYSNPKQKAAAPKKGESTAQKALGFFAAFLKIAVGASGGFFLSKVIVSFDLIPSSIAELLIVIATSIIWLGACILLQKYLILKILKYKAENDSST